MGLHLLGGAGSLEAHTLPTPWSQELPLHSSSGFLNSWLRSAPHNFLMMSLILTAYIWKVDLQEKASLWLQKEEKKLRWVVERWREHSSELPVLRFAAAVRTTPWPGSWLQTEASGRPWVTSGPGLSHSQWPGCPATRKGTKGTFDVQKPSSLAGWLH